MTAKTSLLIASLFALAPFAAHAETPAGYVARAGASDMFEQTASKLVLQSTKDPKVRSFAQMMVRDHAKSTAMVKAAAAKSGVKAGAPHLTSGQQADVTALAKATGTARDKLYWDQQKVAHQQALALHKDYATNGSGAPLKAVAAKIVPVVQRHIDVLTGEATHAHH